MERRKVVEIYVTKEGDDLLVNVDRVEDSNEANFIINKLYNCLSTDSDIDITSVEKEDE